MKLIVPWLGGKETIESQSNHFYKTGYNKVIEFPLLHLTDLTFNV